MTEHETGTGPIHAAAIGKRQRNILADILRGVPLIDTINTVTISRSGSHEILEDFECSSMMIDAASANRVRPLVLEAMIGRTARREGYISGIPARAVKQLITTAGQIAVGKPLVIRIVCGATLETPLRALSYVLPAVQLQARMKANINLVPYVQVIATSRVGSRMNTLALEAVRQEFAMFTAALQKMFHQFDISDHFGIYDDAPNVDDSHLEHMVDTLNEVQRQELRNLLAGKGGTTEYDDKALLYAAAHVALHDLRQTPLRLVHGTEAPNNALFLDVGGLQERYFHYARAILLGYSQGPTTGQLFTRHTVPPYYMARGGDLSLRDHLAGRSIDSVPLAPPARHDLDYLRRHVHLGDITERYAETCIHLSSDTEEIEEF